MPVSQTPTTSVPNLPHRHVIRTVGVVGDDEREHHGRPDAMTAVDVRLALDRLQTTRRREADLRVQ